MEDTGNRTATKEFVESLIFCALMALLAWLYCWATPDQMSGEYDWAVAEEARR